MTLTLTDQDRTTLQIAAYGAVALLAAVDAAGSPHKVATHGSIALASGTGVAGHVLAGYPKGKDLNGKSVAELADKVLPALTAAMGVLEKQDPAEAENYRGIVLVALDTAAKARKSEPTPTMTAMIRKITEALDAA
ncbi:MAG: hypothetical protein HOV68_19140 [Streptomycetaceae bacterium]|nr:hypothetical protein [Streptomycetaceae bacterium]